jgi:hypothetical protein
VDLVLLHESLCRALAYPRSVASLRRAERALARFASRPELRAERERLADTGIAGTPIRYRFFWPTARWLASRWPHRLRLDWDEGEEFEPRLRAAMAILLPWIEAESVKRSEEGTRGLLDRLRGRDTDAAFVVSRIDAIPATSLLKEAIHDALDLPYVLDPGASGPSRTTARAPRGPVVLGLDRRRRVRPDLAVELRRPPRSVTLLSSRDGARYVDLAREAMVTRSRDLDAFSWGSEADVRLVDDGDGLRFAVIGVVPEKRLPLAVAYGWLTLRNGVPIGYVQSDALLGSVEIAFNTFPTFRGGEAAHVFGRVLAVSRRVFSARAFSIEPYQLGHGNAEGIESGAWWFYRKLGFAPKDPAALRLAAREEARIGRDRRYRSSPATLLRLAKAHLFWEPDPRYRADVARASRLGLGLRQRADAADRVAARLGVRSLGGWSNDERNWWERLAPVVAAFPGVDGWSSDERRALVAVIRAKAGRRETGFLARLASHAKAQAALLRLLRARS